MYPCSTVAPLESDPNPTKRNLAKDFDVGDTDTPMSAFIFIPFSLTVLGECFSKGNHTAILKFSRLRAAATYHTH